MNPDHKLHEPFLLVALCHRWMPWTLGALVLCPGLAPAQELEKVLPEEVPKLVDPAGPETPAVDLATVPEETEGAGVEMLARRPGEEVIMAELKGIRIVSKESDLVETLVDLPKPVVIEGVPTLDNDFGKAVAQAFLGQPASLESIERLRVALRVSLTMNGRAFSVVYIPPQDITEGFLQIVVVESTVSELRVEGNKYFSEDSYLSRFKQAAGEAVDSADLRMGVDRINRNSFRNSAVRLEKGDSPGTTAVIIQANERFPLRSFAGYNNTGTDITTEDRMFAGMNWGNAFGLGHMMTLQWTSDLEMEHSRALSGNYTADLWQNHSLTLFGAYSEISSVPNGGLSQEGTSWQAGFNYDIPLQPVGQRYSHNFQLGFDYKASDNNLEIASPPFIIPISNNLTHIAQFRAQYSGQLTDDWGSTSGALKVTFSPGGLGSANDDAAFNATRSFADSQYLYGNLNLTRNTNLRGVFEGWEWTVAGECQIASGNLLGSEQFIAGGSGSVRGYEESEAVGDNALFFSQELRFPSITPAKDLIDGTYQDSLRPFLFHDYAHTWNVDKLPGEKPFNLHSVGVGLNYQFSRYANLRFAYGWQLEDSGSSNTGDNSRAHISFQMSY